MNVTVTVARTALPSTAPVSAEIPLGRSTATTGRPAAFPAALMHSIAAAWSGRTAPVTPVPRSASTTTSPVSSAGSAKREVTTPTESAQSLARAASPRSFPASPTERRLVSRPASSARPATM